MPRYKVTERRFYGDKLYDPAGKRKFLTVDKPFPKGKTPKGLELVKDLSKAEKAAEKKAATAEKKANEERAEQEKIEKDSVTFTADAKPGGTVETL